MITATLPTFESCLDDIAAAERHDGWLSDCADAGRFLLVGRELAALLAKSLAEMLKRFSTEPVLEVCAGRGELAKTLSAEGTPVVATDADPPAGRGVIRLSARAALARYRPAAVLACFAPIDAGVDEAVLACPSVRHYVVLNARLDGQFGSASLWSDPNWLAEPLDEISRWMLTRHDVWLGSTERPILQHGEAWHLYRRAEFSCRGHAAMVVPRRGPAGAKQFGCGSSTL